MNILIYILLVIFLFVLPGRGWWFSKQVHCPQLNNGIFTTAAPYDSLPKPECFVPVFKLFNRNTGPEYINGISISSDHIPSSFVPWKKTIIIVHGLNDKPERGNYWMINSTKNLLQQGDFNVILTDWSAKSSKFVFFYREAASNTRVAGRGISELFLELYSTGLSRDNTYCVGHSLGAHACGYASQYLGHQKFGRITGLDPAGPEFRNLPANARLDKNDADFIDIMHTNGGAIYWKDYGFPEPMGDIDFYPNGGKSQPDCFNKKRGTRSTDHHQRKYRRSTDKAKAQLDVIKSLQKALKSLETKQVDNGNIETNALKSQRWLPLLEGILSEKDEKSSKNMIDGIKENVEDQVKNVGNEDESLVRQLKDILKQIQDDDVNQAKLKEKEQDKAKAQLDVIKSLQKALKSLETKQVDNGNIETNALTSERWIPHLEGILSEKDEKSSKNMIDGIKENVEDQVKNVGNEEESLVRQLKDILKQIQDDDVNQAKLKEKEQERREHKKNDEDEIERQLSLTEREKKQLISALDRIKKGFVAGAFSCSHGIATDYYVESIVSACFKAKYKCNYIRIDKEKMTDDCSSCGASCPVMGYYADNYKNDIGNYTLETTGYRPYCV